MNWKIWGCVALMGLMNIAQGIEFKDAPTVLQVLQDYAKAHPDFQVKRHKEEKVVGITSKGLIGGIDSLAYPYEENLNPSFKPAPIPEKLTPEQANKLLEELKSPKPPKILGAFVEQINVVAESTEDSQDLRNLFNGISNVYLEKCYGFDQNSIEKIDLWMKEQNYNTSSKMFGMFGLYLTHVQKNGIFLYFLRINYSSFSRVPNENGWTQFCRL